MSKRYPLYELSLKLYPKQFQSRYSEQMVQTMTDMLNDQPNKAARALIWLRTGFNLAFTIVQQNIMTLGEHTVNKPTKPIFTYKRLSIVLAGLLLLMTVALHAHIQSNLASLLVRPFYSRGVKTMLLKQNEVLQSPMTRLYGGLPDGVPKAKSGCTTGLVQGIHTSVPCQSTMQAYTKLDQSSVGKQTVGANVQTIEAALKANGYRAGSNDVTLTSLVMGTYEGKDYSPDAYYQKTVGPYACAFDTTVAYSNPSQPAIRSTFWCARTVSILGAPKRQVYGSSMLMDSLSGYILRANN
jgi:hypothetical protein